LVHRDKPKAFNLAARVAMLIYFAAPLWTPSILGCGQATPSADVNVAAPEQDHSQRTFSATPEPTRLDTKHLPNAIRLHEKVISGGQPEGALGFEELAAIGVKTVISVDGATPDVATARKHGLRYVHLPHGYDGISDDRVKELAKAVRDLPGPIYIHCHHGKHRSPAAAATACVAAGLIDSSNALGVLKTAGTNEGYRGLYVVAQEAKRIEDKVLSELKVEFPETAKIPPFAEAMVALEHTHSQLKSIAEGKWKSPPNHPDLAPPHEALLLREHFTEMLRSETAAKHPKAFREILEQSEAAAKELETLLMATPVSEAASVQAKAAFETITKHCADCHKAFRDVPLSEKKLGE
jgi:protein tyrosine phosphatase (PTP) superfamily phosphohydrolase (DUF442 family)